MLMKRSSATTVGFAQSKSIYLYIFIAIAVLLAAFDFGRPLLDLVRRWRVQEEYSHGFLIPFISIWLLWSRRDALRASIGQPSWAGLALIAVAAAMHIVGVLSALFILSQLGFIVALIGIVLGFGGLPLLKVTFIPIIFLLFAIPVPYFIDAVLSFQLQLISSQLGAFLIRLLQIPVFLQGNVIDLGTYKLQVVEACSGLRYLYPLMSLGFLAAYLFQAPFWQRAFVFLSTIPITIFMNSFRIAVVGVMVDNFGPQDADGFLHMFEGWVIFIACSAILVAEIMVFAWFGPKKSFFDVFGAPKISVPDQHYTTLGRSAGTAVGCFLLLAATGIAGYFVSGRQEVLPDRTSFASFPTALGEWQGRSSSLDTATLRGLGLTDYLLTDYAKQNGRSVNFYVAYYASQRSGFAPHSPSVCLPGNGWQISTFQRTFYHGPDMSFPMNRVLMQRDTQKELVYYWFDERGMTVANEWWAKAYLLRDAIFKNRTDGALVRLTTPIYPGEAEADADKRLQSFLHLFVPKLAGYLPGSSNSAIKPAMILKNPKHS